MLLYVRHLEHSEGFRGDYIFPQTLRLRLRVTVLHPPFKTEEGSPPTLVSPSPACGGG